MINAVGRDIPEEILEMTGKEVFQGNHYRDGYVYKKDGPYTKCVVKIHRASWLQTSMMCW